MSSAHIPDEPVYLKPLTFFQGLSYAIRIRVFKLMVKATFFIKRLPWNRDKTIQPTYVKSYPVRRRLKNRVFIPKSHKPGDAPLPLYIDIHGGGFCICDPGADDPFCSLFANKNNILVVALDYPKAPECPYPGPVLALTDLVNAVLEDDDLPFDRKKVAIGGFSAGGNLAIAVCQDKSLQHKIGGIVSYYPVTNFVTDLKDNLASRPKHAPPDPLAHIAPLFDAAYIRKDQDLRDPRLSVAYATRETLPPKILVIGCEFDLLRKDAEDMAERWAGEEGDKVGTAVAWEKNGIKWEQIIGHEHSFDMTPGEGEKKIKNEKRARIMWDSAAEWLFREAYTVYNA